MRYFIYSNNQQQGPYDKAELVNHGLASDTLVWAEGMADWTPAWQVEDLKDVLNGRGTASNVGQTPPIPPSQPQRQDDSCYHEQPQRRRGGCGMTFLVVAVLAVILLALTCPKPEDHRQAVKDEVKAMIDNAPDDTGLFGSFGKMLVSGIADMALGQMLDVDNYVLFSVGKIHYGNSSHTVSFGILNHVFTFDISDLEKALGNDGSQEGVPTAPFGSKDEGGTQENATQDDAATEPSDTTGM